MQSVILRATNSFGVQMYWPQMLHCMGVYSMERSGTSHIISQKSTITGVPLLEQSLINFSLLR